MTRDGKAGEFSPCERMFVCQVPTSPHPLVSDRKLSLDLLGYGFHGRSVGVRDTYLPFISEQLPSFSIINNLEK